MLLRAFKLKEISDLYYLTSTFNFNMGKINNGATHQIVINVLEMVNYNSEHIIQVEITTNSNSIIKGTFKRDELDVAKPIIVDDEVLYFFVKDKILKVGGQVSVYKKGVL